MSPSAAPPTPQEIQRKLSVHGPKRRPTGPVSGTESDSDSGLPLSDPMTPGAPTPGGNMFIAGPSSQPPLSSIAERRSNSGEDSDEEDDGATGGWKVAEARVEGTRSSLEEGVIKAGYLWKKGERRKTWKKRWFVLRPAHLAYYKSSAEYQLLRLLDLSDVHSCTQVNLKRHDNTFGLISPTRTFYLQANDPQDLHNWVAAIEEARQTLLATSTQTSTPTPVPIPQAKARSASRGSIPLSVSPPANPRHGHPLTSSDSEDAGNSPTTATFPMSPSKMGAVAASQPKEPSSKVILSGYLMKCGSKRRNWRKRWFVLSSEKLIYSGSHMDTKPHRQFPFNDILDALEYDLPSGHHKAHPPSHTASSPHPEQDDPQSKHTFKIVTTKRTLLLCAPTEDDEIRWLGAIRALIARRTGSGLVPGTSKSGADTHASTYAQHHQGTSSSPPATSGSSGIKNKVRRMSGAAPTEEAREGRTS